MAHYEYPNAQTALEAKKTFYREKRRTANHCFKNSWGSGYIIFDTREEVNNWYKQHTGHYFYTEDYEPGTIYTKNDALQEVDKWYESQIDGLLEQRNRSNSILAIGLPTSFSNSMSLSFVKSTDPDDNEYRFYVHYTPVFWDVTNMSNYDIKQKLRELIYKHFYSHFKERIEGSQRYLAKIEEEKRIKREETARKAREEEQRKIEEAARRKAKLEAERIEAERLAKEASERRAKEEAARQIKEHNESVLAEYIELMKSKGFLQEEKAEVMQYRFLLFFIVFGSLLCGILAYSYSFQTFRSPIGFSVFVILCCSMVLYIVSLLIVRLILAFFCTYYPYYKMFISGGGPLFKMCAVLSGGYERIKKRDSITTLFLNKHKDLLQDYKHKIKFETYRIIK